MDQFFHEVQKRSKRSKSSFTNPLITVIRATDICDGRTVVDFPSLRSSASSWLSVTNSASMATKSPRPGISSAARGRKEIRWSPSDFCAKDLSSLNTSEVIGLAYSMVASSACVALLFHEKHEPIMNHHLKQLAR